MWHQDGANSYPKSSPKPPYNALISAFEKGKQPEQALEVLVAMQRQCVITATPKTVRRKTFCYVHKGWFRR